MPFCYRCIKTGRKRINQITTFMDVHIYSRGEIDSGLWDEFIRQSPQCIIYGMSGYLDCVCESWKAIIARKGNKWLAVMPLNTSKKYLVTYSLKPPFVQYLGIFFTPDEKYENRPENLKKEIVENIINTIPENIKLFNQNFNPQFNHFLPFKWHGFNITPFQSYCLRVDQPIENIYKSFSASVKRFIRKSETSKLKLTESKSVTWIAQMMQKRNILSPKGVKQFEGLWQFIIKENKGFVLYINNSDNGEVYCGGAFVTDGDRMILLATGTDLGFKKTKAKTLMLWCAIRRAQQSESIRIFDFMGSMISGVVNYINSFGAEPVSYLNISRNQLPVAYSFAFNMKEKIMKKRISMAKKRLTKASAFSVSSGSAQTI